MLEEKKHGLGLEKFLNRISGAFEYFLRGEYPDPAKKEIEERERQARKFHRVARERGKDKEELEEELYKKSKEVEDKERELGEEYRRRIREEERREKELKRSKMRLDFSTLENKFSQSRHVESKDNFYIVLWAGEEMNFYIMKSNRLAREVLDGSDLFNKNGEPQEQLRKSLEEAVFELEESKISGQKVDVDLDYGPGEYELFFPGEKQDYSLREMREEIGGIYVLENKEIRGKKDIENYQEE